MTSNERQYRESSRLPADGWSNWEKALVPLNSGLEHRGNPEQVGLICSSIRSAFPDMAGHCGIYEWRARGTSPGQPSHVVYLGSTCRDKLGALRGRILEYCTNGSHKRVLINDALRKGYELWVRVKIVEGRNPIAGKMLKPWKTHFSIGLTMLGTRESTDKYEIYCGHDVTEHYHHINSRIMTLLF